ncbi:MAG: ATP-binding protein [Planctomycetes bacterium]|nr:ATP-binding protein [Planctomycetota bacterium]
MPEETELKLGTTLEDVIKLFGPEGMIYSRDHDVFVRELVQNALDAIEIRRGLAGAKKTSDSSTIRVSLRGAPSPAIDVEDDGWGMDESVVREHLCHPLRGIRRNATAMAAAPAALIGRFGVGFLSAYKVTDCIEVETAREGCRPLSLMIGIRRGPGDEMRFQGFLGEGPPRAVGTRVRIHLASSHSEVARRARLLATSEAVQDALRHYIRHPLPGVDLLFEDPQGRIVQLIDQPFLGSENRFVHRFEAAGVRGCLALPAAERAGPGAFQVCFRGILVKPNYPTLLPETAAGMIGEIDVTDAQLVDPDLSREEFLDNPKLAALKKRLAGELDRFNAALAGWRDRSDAPRDARPRWVNAIRDGSPAAFDLLSRSSEGPYKNFVARRILQEVQFHESTGDRWLLLPELVADLRRTGRTKLYLMEQDTYMVDGVVKYDSRWVYRSEDLWELLRSLAASRGDSMLLVYFPEAATGKRTTFLAWVREYLRGQGIQASPAEEALEHLEKEPLAGKWPVHAWLAKFPADLERQVKAFATKPLTAGRGWLAGLGDRRQVFLNAGSEEVRAVFGSVERLERDPAAKSMAEAWLCTLAWRPDLAEEALGRLCARLAGR